MLPMRVPKAKKQEAGEAAAGKKKAVKAKTGK